MADIIDLKDGVYEKVISRDFDKKLTKALADKEIWADREDVDAQEAVGYLSSYLEKLIRLCLKDIADENQDHCVKDELALTNELVEKLASRIANLGDGHDVTAEQFLWAWLRSEMLEPKELRFEPVNLYYEALKETIETHEKEELKAHD